MKLQLKRSNVLNEEGNAKSPPVEQMEYGEIAVNYNHTDPVLFIRDSADNVIRLTNIQQIGDGQIIIDAGAGLTASGQNASANQTGDTTRTLQIDSTWLDNFVNTNGNGAINVNAGSGIEATGSNATANQAGDTTRVISLKIDANGGLEVTGAGAAVKPDPGKGITVSSAGTRVNPIDLAGAGLEVDGNKLRVSTATGDGIVIDDGQISVDVSEIINEDDGLKVVNGKISVDVVAGYGLAIVDGSIRVVPEDLVDAGYGLEATTSGLRFAGPWTNIPSLPA